MKKIFLTLLIFVNLVLAQSVSIYSNFGLGELNLNPTARRSGFGLGLAGADAFDINPLNPASNYQLSFVKFLGSLNYNWNSYSDNKSKNSIRTASFDYLLFAFPIQRDYGIVLSGGISPFTRVNYKVLSPQSYFDTIPYQVKYEGLGGITSYHFGLSYKIKEYGAIGVSSNFLIGTINNKLSTEFQNTSFINPVFTTETTYKGFALRFGYISENLKKYFDDLPVRELRIGVSYLTSANLNVERTDLKQGIFIDTTGEASYKTTVPAQISFGLLTKLNDRMNVYVDYLNQDWTKLNTTFQSNYTLVNQNYFSIGFEYLPIARPEKFYEAITYRMGVFYKNLGVAVNNEKINEYGLKAGVSLPIDKLNLIDLGFQYSIRGKVDSNLVKESIFNFWVGINFAELWFVRSEE
ncbi:MAG: hypothetical protein N3F03_08880 [Ignavibacteria bacterium]|nr:hypothetical protein [Ignavibacteria bacterium]